MSKIPLSPLGREEIHKLEYALLIGTLLRPDVVEALRSSEDRLTWVDSLAVAAAALAREKAKMTVSQIADELGRTEATIRNHLAGKTKAGQLVRETYERFVREGVNLDKLLMFEGLPAGPSAEVEELKRKVEELEGKLGKVKEALKSILEELS